jgi:hypothetical protein
VKAPEGTVTDEPVDEMVALFVANGVPVQTDDPDPEYTLKVTVSFAMALTRPVTVALS